MLIKPNPLFSYFLLPMSSTLLWGSLKNQVVESQQYCIFLSLCPGTSWKWSRTIFNYVVRWVLVLTHWDNINGVILYLLSKFFVISYFVDFFIKLTFPFKASIISYFLFWSFFLLIFDLYILTFIILLIVIFLFMSSFTICIL